MPSPIFIQRCPSHRTSCFKCTSPIGQGSLRVYYHHYYGKTEYYHLRCFKPFGLSPVTIGNEVIITRVANAEEIDRVKRWVDRWNRRFVIDEGKVPPKYMRNSVETQCPAAKRPLLEVFRYLSAGETELFAAVTCKAWFHVTRDHELWRTKYVLDFHLDDTPSGGSYRALYIAAVLNRCWVCKENVTLDKIMLMCPIRKRPLCEDCSRNAEGKIVSFRRLCNAFHLAKNLNDLLRFPLFKLQRVTMVYSQDFFRLFTAYAKRRLATLIEVLDRRYSSSLPRSTLDYIHRVDLSNLCEGYSERNPITLAMFTFCGKNEKKEDLDRSVEEFVEEIRESSTGIGISEF